MHLFNVTTIFVVVSLVAVEFALAAFINPPARRLRPEPQLELLSRLALVFGKVMPVWYPVCGLLLGVQTWLRWRDLGRGVLLAADAIWLLASVASIVFLVPLNTRIAEGAADWQRIHAVWEGRHRVRTGALAIAAVLLTYVLAR